MSAVICRKLVRRAALGTAMTVLAIATASQAQTAPPAAAPVVEPYYGHIDPFYRDINAFWRDINPFYGNIDPFWKDINPFYKDINAFWGNIDPFYRDINAFAGEAPPDYAKVGTFWRDFGAFWYNADKEWDAVGFYPNDLGKYQNLQITLNQLVARSEATWGVAVTAKTGKSFREGFANAVFAKYGVDLNNMATFEGLSASRRAHFFLDWYDGLMDYSGADHVDYWMGTVNWSPSLTRIQGGGTGTVIGLIDSTVVNNPDIADNLIYTGGYSNPLNGHGTSVASLLVSAHDGHGLMGIAPNASLAAYNPFDATGTASWGDIATGVVALKARGASVINLSLGVPGWSLHKDWGQVFNNPAVAAFKNNTVYVIAAGNEGKLQTANIQWDFATDPALILVGSVNSSGMISEFSNKPEKSCLLQNGTCLEANRIWNRFIVAPGEAVLVSDGNGGMVRRSGTSLAAPQVTGAIALLHDRWPWLANHPRETVQIILRSAKDLGSSGVDPVYGWGLLDVRASQSPLSFNSLVFYEYRNGVINPKTASAIRSGGVKSTWEADGIFFSMFEAIGATRRDFVVPLSSRLIGQKTGAGGSLEYFQSYLASRFTDWIRTGKFTDFSDVDTVEMPAGHGLNVSVTGNAPQRFTDGSQTAGHMALTISNPETGLAFTGGYGQGSMAINARSGFGLTSDFKSDDGGVNPLLGFASGGSFAAAEVRIAQGLTVTAGVTERELRHSNLPGLEITDREGLRGLEPYRASAINVGIAYDLAANASLSASYSRLDEPAALLGVQSLNPGDLRHGSVTDAATLAATAKLTGGFQISASATAATTHSAGRDQTFTTTASGVRSSAFAVAVAKTGIVGKSDHLRLSLAQPLHIENSHLAFTSIEVVDRLTGEIGPVTQRFDIGNRQRSFTGEMIYAAPIMSGNGEFSLFGRAQLRSETKGEAGDYIVGTRIGIQF